MTSQFLKGLRSLIYTPNFATKYSLRTQPLLDINISNDPMHPLYRRQQEKRERQKDSLLIYMIIPKTVAKHATVRNRCKSRISEAARIALREHGYTLSGKSIERQSLGFDGKLSIKGTLLFLPQTPVISETWDVLRKQVKDAIDKFVDIYKHGDRRSLERRPIRQAGRQGEKIYDGK